MNDTVYKIAIAAFLHDIGKFAERARGHFHVDPEFINNHANLYQPFFNGRHTHKHAVYTAAFIDHIEKFLPKKFNKGNWGLDDNFMNLAAGHHNPVTPLQWVIAIADRVSSGFDRDEFEDYNKEIGFRDYKKTRLLTLFEGISPDEQRKEDSLESYKFRYPLKELSPSNIFPIDKEEYMLLDGAQASKEYDELFLGFIAALENLHHKQHIPLWFEHFDNLLMIYASHIPAATVGKVVPDVSLYDHSKTTSALASAIYLYHLQRKTMEIEKIRDYEDKKFLLVTGDFYGIQNFIFTEGGSANKAVAKLLRGRSFAVSLISELAADMLCREIGLTNSSIILNAAGKFTILAPNTKETRDKITAVEEEINKRLIGMFYGEVSLGISFIAAACNDFVSKEKEKGFVHLWDSLAKESEKKKYNKINLEKYGGVVDDYLDQFNNDLDKKLCPFCGKRPSSPEVESDVLVGKDESACKICRDHIYIGTFLVKEPKIAITTVDAEIYGKKLKEPIFKRYQVSFDVTGKLSELVNKGQLLKYWDISIPKEGRIAKEITAKFINGYVPVYTKEDETEEAINRLLHGNKTEKAKNELFDMRNEDSPKMFHDIAKMSLNKKEDKFSGVEALGVLKADVDNLALIFSCGLKRITLSRLATMSRQMNHYFSVYLPFILSTNKEFKDIYTVFAGGDDLFLIGPWNKIIDFALFLKNSFENYVCGNKKITLSAGISVNKPGEPIPSISERAEDALKKSKGNERNSITLFEETVKWEEFEKLNDIKKTIESWIENSFINNAMLLRLNTFSEMARYAKELKELFEAGEGIEADDWEYLKWRALFKYTLVRNVGKHLKGAEKDAAIQEAENAAVWLEDYTSAMKIPVWQVIYNRR
ncbi:MAG: type III-A CRISPR-associated protein Cas10/Csm1 [Candidatus Kuenenia sp.]|nr:type III-A CRISPR-associated protein Cas10/Csm1 [Candidatus Kuenenia hertensis]